MNADDRGQRADTDDEQGTRDSEGLPVTRRQALAAAGAGAAGLAALAFFDGDFGRERGNASGNGRTGHLPYEVWDEIRTALQTSSDNLPARAAALVEAGDPEAIFAFVRDEIVTLPTERDGIGRFSLNEVVRWGSRGTLRGGAGTPREKAELLADLYTQAGIEADLVEARTPLSKAETKALFLRDVERPFDPDISDEDHQSWLDRLGLDSGDLPSVERLDPDGEASLELAGTILEAIPDEEQTARGFDWRMDSRLPAVRFRTEDDEEDRYANLFANVPFGESGARRIDDIAAASPPDVSVTLSGARASDPTDNFELVSETWPATDVAGRQVVVRTLPGIDPLSQPTVRFSDINAFVPSLSVQGGDMDQATSAELSTLGDAFTRGGDQFSIAEDGTVSRNGEPLAATGDAPAADRVDSVSVTPDASRYPEVSLTVEARDGDGAVVEGLPANAFELREDDTPAAVTLQSNRATPRVLVLYDTSASMPGAYSGAAMTEFVSALEGEIRDTEPDARVELKATGSRIWTAAADAAATDANVVVYATDGHVNDRRTPEIERVLGEGPPVVMLSTENEESVTVPVANEIAELSGGTAVPASDSTAARDAVRSFVAGIADTLAPYQVTYGTPQDGAPGDTHTVSVTTGDATGTGEYTVPDTALNPPRLSSLWLTVAVGRRETTRLLAGYDPETDEAVTDEMLAAVEGALFGSTTLTFEGGSPSLSVWLDDFLAAKGSTADLDAALVADDRESIEQASEAGLTTIPPAAFLLTPPIPNASSKDTLTFPDAIRVAAYTHHPVFGSDTSRVSGDILPLTRYRTVTASEDRSEAFRLTVERTARLALAETAGFEESTQSLLSETSIVPFGTVDAAAWGRDRYRQFSDFVDATGSRAGFRMGRRGNALVPADGSVMAYWQVDRATGGLLGVLPDGTNGGASNPNHERTLEGLSRVISHINLLAMASGAGGLALGLVAAYGQVLARLYAAVAMAIEVMDASALPDAIAEAKATMVCEIAKRAFLDVVPMGSAFSAIENLIGAVGGSSPASC